MCLTVCLRYLNGFIQNLVHILLDIVSLLSKLRLEQPGGGGVNITILFLDKQLAAEDNSSPEDIKYFVTGGPKQGSLFNTATLQKVEVAYLCFKIFEKQTAMFLGKT